MGGLRVIAGEYGGRVLQSVKGPGTRPLLGQVREALFNILGPSRLDGAEVWDLFAGTGASGIEALSRGAARVLFVEKAARALRTLRANLDELGPSAKERSHVLRTDAWQPPAMQPRGEEVEVPPDLVFFDPPYPAVLEDPTRAAARADQLLERIAPGGILCFHFPDGCLDEDDFAPVHDVDLRNWGGSAIAIIRKNEDAAVTPSTEVAAEEAEVEEAEPEQAGEV